MKKQSGKQSSGSLASGKTDREKLISEMSVEEEELRSLIKRLDELIQKRATRYKRLNERLQEVMQEAREYAENIVETVPDPLLVLDSSLRIDSANRAFYVFFNVSREETEGKYIFDIGNRQWNIPKLRELLGRAIPARTVLNDFEVEHDFENIGHRIMLVNARQISRKTAGQQLILLSIKDITEQRNMENELKISNERLQQFAYIASHDLQSPLRNVEGFTNMLARRYKGKLDAKAEELIGYISTGVRTMQVLILDILEYSKVGKGKKSFAEVSTLECVRKAISNLGEMISARKARIHYDEDLPLVSGDQVQLTSLFQNLIQNAVKYSDGIPEVSISAKREEKEYVFSVNDKGIGFEEKYSGRIFDLFQRLHGKEYAGTGIGLAICKNIVEQHGGHIWVESEPGKGTTFFFTLPARRS